jgi:dTMP kinase
MKFIVFEGLDGSGKTTQVRLLAQRLEESGIPCLVTRQPSDSAVGKVMRSATDAKLPLENETMALLVAADRYQHVYDIINPALDAGKIVVCDRYYYSSFAFQGIDGGAFGRVAAYNERVMAQRKPDITFFLDTSPEECMRRIQTGRNYGGLYDSVAQLRAVRERYLRIFDELKDRENIVFVEGGDGEEAVASRVWAYIKNVGA